MFITIKAKIRNIQGKSANCRLRTINKFPAIIYGGETPPIPIELDHEKVWNLQTKVEFYNEVLILLLDDKEEKVKVQAIQRHAFKAKLTHIDFIRVY